MNKSSFVIDSNAFAINSNRTRVIENERNRIILNSGVEKLINYLEKKKSNNSQEFRDIFSSCISTRNISEDESDKLWQNGSFIDLLHKYACENVPTKDLKCIENNCAAYKDTKLPICNLTDLGIDFDWYYWDIENEDGRKEFSVGDNSVLNLESYNIKRILKECDSGLFNKWVRKISDSDYLLLLQEIKSCYRDKSLDFSDLQIQSLKLFRENKENYSLHDVLSTPRLLNSIFNFNNKFPIK